MHSEVITSEERYTLNQARQIIISEQKEKREQIVSRICQTAVGLLLVGISMFLFFSGLLDGDGTVPAVMCAVGLTVICTKEHVIN